MRYLVRSAKYFAAFCVLYVAIIWISVKTTSSMDVSVWDYIVATFATTRGKLLGVAVVVLSALYPRMGFMTRQVQCDMTEERDFILSIFAVAGFTLKEESQGRMVFRADNILSRIVMLFEDEIVVEQNGPKLDITGIRRAVAKVIYRMGL
ncbi:MAG: hypothetical protein J6Q29_04160 [Alistipes sp.]|nr:hypothetical protein [Alistipes sp.]